MELGGLCPHECELTLPPFDYDAMPYDADNALQTASAFYKDYCKSFLWPTFHYLGLSDHQDQATEAKAWQAYYDANVAYAKKVAEVYKDGDLVSFCIRHRTEHGVKRGGGLADQPGLAYRYRSGSKTTISCSSPSSCATCSQRPPSGESQDATEARGVPFARSDDHLLLSLFLHSPFPSSEFFRCLPSECMASTAFSARSILRSPDLLRAHRT